MTQSRGGKFLVGCLAVTGAIVVLLVVAGITFTRWVRTPGRLLDGARLLDERTVVHAEIRLLREDSGARAIVRAVMTAQRKPGLPRGEKVPKFVRWFVGSMPEREVTDQEIGRFLPIELTVTCTEAAPGHAGPALIAASIPGIGNGMRLMDWILLRTLSRNQEVSQQAYGQETLYQLRTRDREAEPLWAAIVGTDVLVSTDEATLKAGIDRLATVPSETAPTALPAPFHDRPSDALLFMGARAGFGEALADILEWPAPAIAAVLRPKLKGSGAVVVRASLVSADSLEGTIRIVGGDAEGVAAGTSPRAQEVALVIAGEPVSFSFNALQPSPTERKAWRFTITGLEAVARHGLRSPRVERPRRHTPS